jgi:hypothetical protein
MERPNRKHEINVQLKNLQKLRRYQLSKLKKEKAEEVKKEKAEEAKREKDLLIKETEKTY